MGRLIEPKKTEHGGQVATLFCALILAIVGASSLAIEAADAQATPLSQAIKSGKIKSTKPTKSRKSYRRRSISKMPIEPVVGTAVGRSSQAEPELRALTPHTDLTSGQKADAEVTSVLKYGARKHAEGNYEEAEAAFRHVLSRDPSNVDAFYDLGALAERKGDLIAALSSYRAALALKPHDKEIVEAVSSIERALRNRPAFSFRENNRQAARGPSSSAAQMPSWAGNTSSSTSVGYDGAPVLTSPVLSSPVLSPTAPGSAFFPGLATDLPPVSPQLGPALSADPTSVAPGTFQLSSAKNGLLSPTLGVTQAASLPAAAPVVGVAPRSHPVARMFLNTALNQGASIGLRAAGLHCPACHFMRFRF